MKSLFLSISLLLCTGILYSQLNIGGKPYSFKEQNIQNKLRGDIPTKEMPSLDVSRFQKEDVKDERNGKPPRFEYPLNVDYNLDNSGTWIDLGEQGRLWQLSIASKGAKSINLAYDDFWLPPGATFYLYSADRKKMLGGFTERNNKGLREDFTKFSTGLIYSERIFLEYYEPKEVIGLGQISIAKVIHGYRKIQSNKTDEGLGLSDACQMNINCEEGAEWQLEKKGVARVLVGEDLNRWCSGALLNTSDNDLVPYFLTANHCLDGWAVAEALDAIDNPDASDWHFNWHYESPNCEDIIDDTLSVSTTGAVLVANRPNTDFALFRLIEDPRECDITYLGWTTNTTRSKNTTAIHHPRGDLKKISFDNDKVIAKNTNEWKVVFDEGGTEKGSSGSPLFDQNKRVIGQLWGGGLTCTGAADYYGRLDVSFKGTNQNRRLRDWVYPNCNRSNLVITENFSQEMPLQWSSDIITATNIVDNNVFVTYKAADAVVLKAGFEAQAGTEFTSKIGDCTNRNTGAGTVTVNSRNPTKNRVVTSATSKSNPISKRMDQKIAQSEITVQLYPNPTQGLTNLIFLLPKTEPVAISLFNGQGQLVQSSSKTYNKGRNEFVLNSNNRLPAGIYIVRVATTDTIISKSLVVSAH